MNLGALSLMSRTSSRRVFNIAGWHSRHSLTWSWVLAVTIETLSWPKPFAYWGKHGFGIGLGQMFAFTVMLKNQGWDVAFSLLWVRLTLMRQHEMWFVDLYRRARDDADGLRGVQDVEALAVHEYRDGVSPGAAARQMCRSLAPKSTLRRMLEDMLADGNRASFDRYMILQRFQEHDAEAGLAARLESFDRINGRESVAQHAPGRPDVVPGPADGPRIPPAASA